METTLRNGLVPVTVLAILAFAGPASADLIWSLDNNGTWATGSNWTPAGPPLSTDTVVFQDAGITTGRTITLSGGAGDVANTVNVTGSYGWTWKTGALTVGAGGFNYGSTGTSTFSGTLAGAGAVNMTAGTLNLATGTYTGSTIVGGGTTLALTGSLTGTSGVTVNGGGNLQFVGGGTTGFNNTRLADTIPVTLRSGTLSVTATYASDNSNVNNKETVGTVNLDYGHSTLDAYGQYTTARLTVNNLVHQPGSTVYFHRASTSTSVSGGRFYLLNVNGTPTTNSSLVGGWAYEKIDETNTPDAYRDYDFASIATFGSPAQYAVMPMLIINATSGAVTGTMPRPAQVAGETAGTSNVKTTAAQNTLTANASINSLAVRGAFDNNLGGYQLNIVTGGLLHWSPTASDYTISNGSLTSSGSDGMLYLNNQTGAMTVSANIVGATVGVTTAGSMTLSGNNTFGGDLYVNVGTLTLSNSNTFTGTAQVVPGAILQIGAAATLSPQADVSLLFDGAGYGKLDLLANVAVKDLFLGGVAQLHGTYGAVGSGATYVDNNYFSGAGVLTVVPEPVTLAFLAVGGLGLAGVGLRRRRVC
ncbi:MAG: hypothetical protein PHU85_06280 [Phycisphaerae bacterium]|nr:hypothetical protein [Phycisphaerae bacterium]